MAEKENPRFLSLLENKRSGFCKYSARKLPLRVYKEKSKASFSLDAETV